MVAAAAAAAVVVVVVESQFKRWKKPETSSKTTALTLVTGTLLNLNWDNVGFNKTVAAVCLLLVSNQ